MTSAFKSVFYDGQSSIPFSIDLFFDSNNEQFTFHILTPNTGNEIEESSIENTSLLIWKVKEITFEHRNAALFLEHGNDPIQTIKVTDTTLIKTINEYRKNSGQMNWYQKLILKPMYYHVFLALFLIGTIGLAYVYILPWVAEKSVVLIPESFDDTLGGSFIDEHTLFGNSQDEKSKIVTEIASELELNNKKSLQFIVVDSDVMNAYALPNGTIVIYTGILKEMKSYDELVGLIGHEVAHVNNRHSIKMLCRNLSGYLFVSTILGDVNGIMAVIGDNVNTLQSLSFSREFEKEADEDGFDIVTQNNVNPKGMITLFHRLEKEDNIKIPEFLNTHPITKNRIQNLSKLIDSKTHVIHENIKLKMLFDQLKK